LGKKQDSGRSGIHNSEEGCRNSNGAMDVDGDEEMGDNIDIDGSATKRF
jgi:hypothetical protein